MGSLVRRTSGRARPQVPPVRPGRAHPQVAPDRPGRQVRLAHGVAMCLLLAAAAGCTDTTRPAVDERPVPATSTGPVRPDPNFAPPHSAAGDRLLTTFPAPADLGPGWSYAEPPGRHSEDPGVGVVRDVDEIVDGSVPGDCLRLAPMPLPLAAAEVRYRFEGVPVHAFVVGLDGRAVTRAFFSLLVRNLEDCEHERGDDGADLVGQVVWLDDRVVLSDRFPATDRRRTDLAVLADTSVALLEAPVALGAEPFTSRRSLEIARVFREAAARATETRAG